MHQILAEFGPERVTLAIAESAAHTNGKIQNLEGAYPFARHDVFVISDSDICLRPDYLRAIVAPLADPAVGCVSTPYRAMNAAYWFEKLELLTMNADFVPNLIFASVAGIVTFGLGASMCFRRKDLEAIGGFAAFGEHLAEDSHMAARLEALGRRVVLAPYFVDMEVDLKSFSQWWGHQLYWDQNTRVDPACRLFRHRGRALGAVRVSLRDIDGFQPRRARRGWSCRRHPHGRRGSSCFAMS